MHWAVASARQGVSCAWPFPLTLSTTASTLQGISLGLLLSLTVPLSFVSASLRALFITQSQTLLSEIEKAFRSMQAAVLPPAEMLLVKEASLRLAAAPASLRHADYQGQPLGACWPLFFTGKVCNYNGNVWNVTVLHGTGVKCLSRCQQLWLRQGAHDGRHSMQLGCGLSFQPGHSPNKHSPN